MSDVAAREMTADEWAFQLVGASKDDLAIAIQAAEARGYRRGQVSMRGALDHFEVAYRYAVNASGYGVDRPDLLASAKMFADIGYAEMQKSNI